VNSSSEPDSLGDLVVPFLVNFAENSGRDFLDFMTRLAQCRVNFILLDIILPKRVLFGYIGSNGGAAVKSL